jgi:phosphohistidine phosphatase
VQLVIVRHAKAESGEPDELRRLTADGRRAARGLGERLAHAGVRADAILTSPLLRARETGAELAKELGVEAEPHDRLAPGATADDVRAAVAGRGETVVVVGHQPDCGRIAAEVTGGPEPSFPAAGHVIVELQDGHTTSEADEAAGAERWFNARNWKLRTYREGDEYWTDLIGRSGPAVEKYGRGSSAEAAILSAKDRWDVEQEGLRPLPRRLP